MSEKQQELTAMAAQLLENLLEDVEKCSTREAHVRATARANEMQHLLIGLNRLAETDEGPAAEIS